MALIIHLYGLIGYHDSMMDTIVYNTSSWHARTLTFCSFWNYLLVIQWMPCYCAPHVDLRNSLHSYPNIARVTLDHWSLGLLLGTFNSKTYCSTVHIHHVVERRFIVHLHEFYQSSIALSKSMPFTWCVLSFANKFFYHAQSTVLFPLISAFFSTQEMTWALNLPHFDFMLFIHVTATGT